MLTFKEINQAYDLRMKDHYYKYPYVRIAGKLSFAFIWIFLRIGASANQVTGLRLILIILGGAALIPCRITWNIIAVIIFHLDLILDVADGMIATIKNESSLTGRYLDNVCHSFSAVFIVMGIFWGQYTINRDPLFLQLALLAVIFGWSSSIFYSQRYVTVYQRLAGNESCLLPVDNGGGSRLYSLLDKVETATGHINSHFTATYSLTAAVFLDFVLGRQLAKVIDNSWIGLMGFVYLVTFLLASTAVSIKIVIFRETEKCYLRLNIVDRDEAQEEQPY